MELAANGWGQTTKEGLSLCLLISRTTQKKILCKTNNEAYDPFDTCKNQKYCVPNLCLLLFTLGYGDIMSVFFIFIYNAND
jgi:hypothetical protein